jgi:hypothetical protein
MAPRVRDGAAQRAVHDVYQGLGTAKGRMTSASQFKKWHHCCIWAHACRRVLSRRFRLHHASAFCTRMAARQPTRGHIRNGERATRRLLSFPRAKGRHRKAPRQPASRGRHQIATGAGVQDSEVSVGSRQPHPKMSGRSSHSCTMSRPHTGRMSASCDERRRACVCA